MESMVEVLDRVGAALREEYGDAPIPSARIRSEVENIRGQKPGAGCPADLCYNVKKSGMRFPNTPMFVQFRSGLYHYVGLNYPFTGDVFHSPKGGERRQVGEWVQGKVRLY